MQSPSPISGALAALLERPDLWRGDALSMGASAGVRSGCPALDAELPGHGWPRGALTEIFPVRAGIGELRLLGPALALIAREGQTLAWIAPPYRPYAPALAAAGIDLARIIIVSTRSARDTLWSAEQALRSNACGAVLAWLDRPRYAELRRLQIAAEGTPTLGFLFREMKASGESSPAPLRLALDTAAGGLSIRVLKRRGAPLLQPVLLPALLYPPHHALDRLPSPEAAARNLRLAHA